MRLSKKQKKIAQQASPFDSITGADFAKLKKLKQLEIVILLLAVLMMSHQNLQSILLKWLKK